MLPNISATAYVGRTGAPCEMLYEAAQVRRGAPLVFPESKRALYDLGELAFDFPAVTVAVLKDTVVRGRSNVPTTPEALVWRDLVDLDVEIPPEAFYDRLVLSADHAAAEWRPHEPFEADYLPEAAVFTDGTSFNYAHWLTEILPRIAAFAASGRAASTPLIIDAELHPNMERSIALAAGPDATLHRLRPDQVLRVGRLHNVSPVGYVPFKLRTQAEQIPHGLFAPGALGDMVARLRGAAGAGDRGARPRVLIRRNAAVRHMVNAAEIEAALVERGFQVVEPERLSFEAQVALYGSARLIVGPTGAAMANVMFCQPDCPMIVMTPWVRYTGYWYWRRIAAATGAGPVVMAIGEQISPMEDVFHPDFVHADFRVEVQTVLDAVDAAEALSG